MPRMPRVQCNRRAGRKPWYTLRINRRLHYLGTDVKSAYRKAADLIAGAQVSGIGPPHTVAGLVLCWLHEQERPGDAKRLKVWAEFEGAVHLAEFGDDGLERYLRHLKRKKFAAWTIRKYVQHAVRVCRWAIKKGWLPPSLDIPVRLPKPVQRPRDVSEDVLTKVFEMLPPRPKAIVSFILATGCRPGEAYRLKWEHVDLKRGMCILPSHKTAHSTGRVRTIYLTPPATKILQSLPGRDGHVFVNTRGRPYTADTLRGATKSRGLGDVYSLRHTAAQGWLDQGVSLEDVAKLLGHSDLRQVQVYAQIRDQRAREVAQSLRPLAPLQALHDSATSGDSASPSRSRGKKPRSRRERATGSRASAAEKKAKSA